MNTEINTAELRKLGSAPPASRAWHLRAPLGANGSFSKRRMPATENVRGCVDIAVMRCSAVTANPFSYSKACDTFRPRIRQTAAIRAGLGGKSFIDFQVARAMPNGLVRELIPESRPTCIHNGLRHFGLGKAGRVHVPHGYEIKLSHDAIGELVQEVFSAGRNFAAHRSNQAALFGTVRLGQLFLQVSEVLGRSDLFAIGQNSELFEPEINANSTHHFALLGFLNLDNDVQVPVALCIPGETGAVDNLTLWQRTTGEHPEGVAADSEGIPVPLDVILFDRNPAQRFFPSVTKIRASLLLSRPCVLLTYRIYGGGQQAQLFTASSSQIVEGESAQPSFTPLQRVFLPIIAEVPDEINRSGLLIQKASQGLNAVSVDNVHSRNYAPHQEGLPQ
jgi:hypothetical protein